MRALALFLSAVLAAAPLDAATKRHIVGRHSPEPPFGVVLNVTAQSDPVQIGRALDLAAAAGVRWVRVQFTWSTIQPSSPAVAVYSLYDQIVFRAAQRNLNILGVLGFATPWDTTAPDSETRPAQREHYPPADLDAWARYVTLTVKRYQDRVHYWEIWNEPDRGSTPDPAHPCNGFWCGTPSQYAHLLNVTYKTVKAADDGAVVLLGGLAMDAAENPNFLYLLLTDPDYPGWQSFDFVSIHSFGSAADAQRRMNSIRSQLAYGGAAGRTVWVTAFGYGSDPAVQNVAGYSGGEPGQAAYAHDMSLFLLGAGAKKIFWDQLFDGTTAGDNLKSYGLLTSALEKKQAYDAYTDVINSYRP